MPFPYAIIKVPADRLIVSDAEASHVEPPSAKQGAGTVDSPYDGGNAPDQLPTSPVKTNGSIPSADSPESPSTVHQGSGLPEAVPNAAQVKAIQESTEKMEAEQKTHTPSPTRRHSKTPKKSTGLAANGGDFDAARQGAGAEAARLRELTREVSPGTMPDGSHAITSGDRGESYSPTTLAKLKGKFHFGK